MSQKPFIESSLFYLHTAGLNPEKDNLFSKIRTAVVICVSVLVFSLIFLEIAVNWKGIESLLNGATTIVAYILFFLKVAFFILYRPKLRYLLTDLQKFWSVDEAEISVRVQIDKILGFIDKVLKSIKICFAVLMFSYFGKAVIARERKFPFTIYQPFDLHVTPYFEILYLSIFINSFFALAFLLGFDVLFIALITHIVCEFKMLKYKFANVKINADIAGDEEKCLQELSRLVDHHCFIMQFIKDVRELYSLMMLSVFFMSLFCICLSLFTLSGEGFPPRIEILAQCVTFLLTYAGELFIYCAGGNIITVESSSVADAVYESDWWIKTQPKLRIAVALVILRAQKGEKMTAGGMLELNLESFTNVMRTSMSFFTLMHAVYSNGEQDALNEFQ